MRWEGQRESENIEDRRGFGPVGTGTGIGLGGLVLILAVSFLTGTNPLTLLNLVETVQEGPAPPAAESPAPTGPPTDTLGRFAAVVLANTEDTWKAVLPELGRRYEEPRLVLFTGAVRSACGFSSSAVGPFYCSMDRKVYLDLSFFKELADRFGAPGDFAQAYVIAHEVGHHVQTLIGIADRVARLQRGASEREANALSVRMELQADCLAGVWGYHAKEDKLIEPGDFEDGLRAASAIGDDRLQRLSQGVSADAISPKIAELKSPLNTESQCLFTDHSDGGGTDAAKGGLYGDSGIGGTRTLSLRHRQTGRRTSADGASGP